MLLILYSRLCAVHFWIRIFSFDNQWWIQDFPDVGANLEVEGPTYYFGQFCPEKLHEIEKKLNREGARVPSIPLRSAHACCQDLFPRHHFRWSDGHHFRWSARWTSVSSSEPHVKAITDSFEVWCYNSRAFCLVSWFGHFFFYVDK